MTCVRVQALQNTAEPGLSENIHNKKLRFKSALNTALNTALYAAPITASITAPAQ